MAAVIRATLEHLDVLANLFNDYRTFYGCQSDLLGATTFLSQRLSANESVAFVALSPGDNGEGLGFTQLYPAFSSIAMEPIWILNDLFVAESARRQGWGRALLQAAKDYALGMGAARLELATTRDNHGAKALYNSFGYEQDQLFDHFQLSLKRYAATTEIAE